MVPKKKFNEIRTFNATTIYLLILLEVIMVFRNPCLPKHEIIEFLWWHIVHLLSQCFSDHDSHCTDVTWDQSNELQPAFIKSEIKKKIV